MEALGKKFSFNYTKRQIYYTPYYLNLIIKLILYNNNKNNIIQLFKAQGDTNFNNKDKKEQIIIIINKITKDNNPLNNNINKSKEAIFFYA